MKQHLLEQLTELDVQAASFRNKSPELKDISNNVRTAIYSEMDYLAYAVNPDIEEVIENMERIKQKINYIIDNDWQGTNIALNAVLALIPKE